MEMLPFGAIATPYGRSLPIAAPPARTQTASPVAASSRAVNTSCVPAKRGEARPEKVRRAHELAGDGDGPAPIHGDLQPAVDAGSTGPLHPDQRTGSAQLRNESIGRPLGNNRNAIIFH